MTRLDPIIAVKNVTESAKWYQRIFGFRNAHGGENFSVLMSEEEEVVLCLHRWEAHNHPTMQKPDLTPGNGLLLYFRTRKLQLIYENALHAGCTLEADMHRNENSLRQEFSFRDPDGYYLTVTEYHRYEG